MIKLTKNTFAGILITSILFSAIHLSYYGFLPRLALGLIIGYVFYFSKNLWLSSLTHFLYNFYGISEVYALSRKGLITPDDLKDGSFPLFYGLIAAMAIYVIFIFFKKESEVVISTYNLREVTSNE
jgi:membrane protease YdiL (CAAX protease family)